MRIVIVHPQARTRRSWRRELARGLPDARLGGWPADEALGPLPDAEYAVGWVPEPEFFAAHPRLQVFFNAGAGVDHLLAQPQLPPGLLLVRLEDAGMATQMAAYCSFELMRLDPRHEAYAVQQRACQWKELEPLQPQDWPVGVFGLGALGTHVARSIAALGYRVNGFARSRHSIERVHCYGGARELEPFLNATRVLILLAPLTDATRDLFDRRRLSMLPAGAYLINVARGALVVDRDLIAAVDSGQLSGATLDVFRDEPLPAEHPFWRHPAIRVTPHVAAATLVAPAATQVIDKLNRMRTGAPVSGVVERMRGY